MVASGKIAVAVVSTASIILNADALDIHGVGGASIQWSASPLASPLCLLVSGGGGISTSNPGAHLDAHRSLGVVEAVESLWVVVGKGANQGVTNVELDRLLGPVERVSDVLIHRTGDRVGSTTIVSGGVSLSEEVALDVTGISTNPLEINLIQILRLEDETADDTGTWGGLHGDGDLSEEDVLVDSDGWGIGLLADGKLGTVRSILEGSPISDLPVGALLGEIGDEGRSQSWVGRAGWGCVNILFSQSKLSGETYSSWLGHSQ